MAKYLLKVSYAASSGAIDSYETVVLLSPSEVDAAMNVVVDYAPPGS